MLRTNPTRGDRAVQMADRLLANPVIEVSTVTVIGAAGVGAEAGASARNGAR